MSSPRKILRAQENVEEKRAAKTDFDSSKVAASIECSTADSDQGPPKAPRSAFMCFTDSKKKEIMATRGLTQDNADVLNLVAQEWRGLSDRERAYWDEEARNDKVRFVREKAEYKGPWAIPKRRAKKHPLAPKRPMSAFLKYSQKRRALVKKENPDMSNTDVSRLLGEMWRNASPAERAPYVEQEQRERGIYKAKIKKFRDEQARMDAASRTSHQTVQKMVEYPGQQLYDGSSVAAPGSFDSVRIDAEEEGANKGDQQMMFRHAYSASTYASYRTAPPEGSVHHAADRQDADHLVPAPHGQFQALHMEDENSESHYSGSRNRYFGDGMNFSFYGRYP